MTRKKNRLLTQTNKRKMHESKGEVKMEIQLTPLQRSLNGDSGIKSGTNSGLALITNGNSRKNSESGDESSGDEPLLPAPPKKNRLKEANGMWSTPCSLSRSSPIPIMLNCVNGSRKDVTDEQDEPEDDDSRLSIKEGVSASFTSGENSDAEVGPDGDESNGSDMKQEDSRKVFECDVCNMKFSNGANMRRHRMRHSGIKPYECKICKKRFFRKDHLAEHMATHSKLLPFRCPICNKGFQRQIAMRAHFQNEHVGGTHDMVKACPLCSYKAGSMKSLRVHFYSRHGIDLDNPMPHSPLLGSANGGCSSPGMNGNGEYSELAHALGFEDREKSSDSIIPSHFLVPQIEISSNSSFLSHFPFNGDSHYNFAQDERHNSNGGSSSPSNISPLSDRSSNVPSVSDLSTVVVKKEVLEDQHLSSPDDSSRILEEPSDLSSKPSEIPEDVQDSPEDLSSGNSTCYRSSHSPKTSSFSIIKISPLKSLLREDSNGSKDKSPSSGTNHNNNNANNSTNTSTNGVRTNNTKSSNSGHSSHSNNIFGTQPFEGSESLSTSSTNNGTENATASHSRLGRRGTSFSNPIHQCVYCGIIFPDKTLYFLHKGCHSDSNPWRCNICGEFCFNVYDFNSHLLSKSHQ